jgi:hypothetical protein
MKKVFGEKSGTLRLALVTQGEDNDVLSWTGNSKPDYSRFPLERASWIWKACKLQRRYKNHFGGMD